MIQKCREHYNINKSRYFAILAGVFICGILAHGFMFFNKISFNDDIGCLFGNGDSTLIVTGRWFLWFLQKVVHKLFYRTYSIPVYNGILSLSLIAINAIIISDLFKLRSKINLFCLGAIMAVMPCITSLFAFMYCAPYYLLGETMAIIGVFLLCWGGRWYGHIAGVFLISCSLGVYQAYFSFVLCILILYVVLGIMRNSGFSWKKYIKICLKYLMYAILSLIIYYAITFLACQWHNTDLSTHAGLSDLGNTPIATYLNRVPLAYKLFIQPAGTYNMYVFKMIHVYKFILLMLAASVICILYRLKGVRSKIQFMLLVLLFPTALNILYVINEYKWIHSLQAHSQTMIFVVLMVFLENMDITIKWENIKKNFVYLGQIILAISIIMWVRYANVLYLKAILNQTQTINWDNRLAQRIESVEGYSDELPVAYVNRGALSDRNMIHMHEFDAAYTIPYNWEFLTNYSWKTFMAYWCNFNPVVVEDVSGLEQLPEVIAMPSYPDDGSIRIINDTIVVKF